MKIEKRNLKKNIKYRLFIKRDNILIFFVYIARFLKQKKMKDI